MPPHLAAANAVVSVTHDLVRAPAQLRHLTIGTVDWVMTDSTAALVGVASAVGLYLLFVGLRLGLTRLLGRDRDVATWRGFAGRLVARTRSVFLGAAAAHLAARIAPPPAVLLAIIGFAFTVAAVVQGAIWAREIVLALVDRRAAASTDKAALASAENVIRVLVNVVVWSLATVLVLGNLGVNVTALVAGLGVGGIAIGLAAQGIFADLFAALAILFDRPFGVGDTVRWGQVTGTVEAIGLKTVRLRSVTGEQVIVGNTKLLGDQIANLTRIDERQVVMTVAVAQRTPPDLLDRVPAEAEAIVAAVPGAHFDRAHLVRFTEGALEIEIAFFTAGQSFKAMMDARHAVGIALLRRFAELGIDLADPVQIVRASAGERPPVPPSAGTTGQAEWTPR